jgi:transposase
LISIDDGRPFAVKNDEPSLRRALKRLPQACRVHIESSGGHERLAARLLRDAGHEVVTHNPLKARRLAQAQGVRAKTDPVDARKLSRSGALIPACAPKTIQRQALGDHPRAIEAINGMISELRMRARLPELDAAS